MQTLERYAIMLYRKSDLKERGRLSMKKENMCKAVSVLILGTVILSAFSGCEESSDNTDKTESVASSTTELTSAVITETDVPEPSSTESTQESTSQSSDLIIGETVTFGRYEQDNDTTNGAEPIEWQVADIVDDRALLISSYILDNVYFNKPVGIYGDRSSVSLPWAQSYIYSWLNEDFKNSAFTEEELKRIIDTTAYADTDSSGRKEVIGSVFLLSYEEAVKYFELETVTIESDSEYESDNELYFSNKALCKPTAYAIEESVDTEEFLQEDADEMLELGFNCSSEVIGNTYADYWLRSSYNWDSWFTAEGHAVRINTKGSFDKNYVSLANVKEKRNGIRPCIWITLNETVEETTEATTIDDNTKEPADLSFLYGSPNMVTIWAYSYGHTNEDGLNLIDIDVVDTGSCYRLGLGIVNYSLGINCDVFDEFMKNAVQSAGYVQDEDGKGRFTYDVIEENADLVCYGETFTLTSYYENDAGRGFCEFLGEDGKVYYINNTLSFLMDDFTGLPYFKLVTTDGEDACREKKLNGEYIDVPYDMAERTFIKYYVEYEGDISGSDAHGYFSMQFDSEGNLVQFYE